MDYARDVQSGEIVAAENASRWRVYVCPRPGCGGHVYLPRVVVQRPHFRHYPGEGTLACDGYVPTEGLCDDDFLTITAVEENPNELGLLLSRLDGQWELGLRLPEIPNEELGEESLNGLRSAFVIVYSGQYELLKVGALELRPGIGSARVGVLPSLLGYRTEPGGLWPASIYDDRWCLESKGIEPKGALFRMRNGEWTRLLAGSQVHYEENLLLLADANCPPPDTIIQGDHVLNSSGGAKWKIWELLLPREPEISVVGWLARLGHDFVERGCRLVLITPPRAYGDRVEPVFWVGDSPVLMFEAREATGIARIAFQSGSNSQLTEIRPSEGRFSYFSVNVRDAGPARLDVVGEQAISLEITFLRPPTEAFVHDQLLKTARLRIQIGEQVFEAWRADVHKVRVLEQEQPLVSVEFGYESARARVTVLGQGRRRSSRGLDSRGVAKVIENSLENAERIEVDAENLGRIVLMPVRTTVGSNFKTKSVGRLEWREYVLSQCLTIKGRLSPALLLLPGTSKSLAIRRVAPGSLVHSRLELRRRQDSRGSSL